MANKKKLFQLFLFSFALLIIFLTYFSNFQKKQTITETKKDETINEEFLVEGVNRFENVEYQGIDKTGNQFTIGSNFAEFEKERPEIIKMEIVKCIFTFKDNTTLTVTSDKGTYNNVTNDMEFTKNVKVNYLECIRKSSKFDVLFTLSNKQLCNVAHVIVCGRKILHFLVTASLQIYHT